MIGPPNSTCDWDAYLLYKKIIGPLRIKAKELGYALTIHGTLKRDIDLVAVPWIEEAVSPRALAEALQKVIEAVHGEAYSSWYPGKGPAFTLEGGPGMKPHGRLGWVYNLGGGPYIDLAVFPPTQRPGDVKETVPTDRPPEETPHQDRSPVEP